MTKFTSHFTELWRKIKLTETVGSNVSDNNKSELIYKECVTTAQKLH